MTIAKNIEISSSSTVSFEDAIKQGIAQVNKTESVCPQYNLAGAAFCTSLLCVLSQS